MRKRPLSVTLIGWIFVAAGLVGLAYHAREFRAERPFDSDFLWVCFVRLLAMFCGAFVLRGSSWARWLLVVWLGYHVGLSVVHTPIELAVHSLLFVGLLFFLFRSPASAYFRSPKPDDTKIAEPGAPPNGGPAASVENSSVPSGPPSVS